MTAQLCTEAPTETNSQDGVLNALCTSGQLGTTASSWQQLNECQTDHIGGCERTVNGIDVVTWVYADIAVSATDVQVFCTSLHARYITP